eukprot:6593109-Prymnesium_polylepis.1
MRPSTAHPTYQATRRGCAAGTRAAAGGGVMVWCGLHASSRNHTNGHGHGHGHGQWQAAPAAPAHSRRRVSAVSARAPPRRRAPQRPQGRSPQSPTPRSTERARRRCAAPGVRGRRGR